MDRSIQRDRSVSPARSSLFSRFSRPVTPIRTLNSPPLTHEEAEELTSPYQYHSGYTYANSLLYRDSMADSDIYEIPNLSQGLDRPRYSTIKQIKKISFWERVTLFLQSFSKFLWSTASTTSSGLGFLLKLLMTIVSIPVYILILGFVYPIYFVARYAVWKTHFVGWKVLSALGITKRHVHFSDSVEITKEHGFVDRYLEYYQSWGFFEGLFTLLWEAAGPSKPWSFVQSFTELIDEILTSTTFFPGPFRDYFFRWRAELEHPKIFHNKLASRLLDYTTELRSKSLLSPSTNGHPNARRSKIEVDQTIVISNGSPFKKGAITGGSSTMREEIEKTRSLRNRTPVKTVQDPIENLTTTPTRRGRPPKRALTRRAGDTDDEGFESGSEKNSQREAFAKWSNGKNHQLGAFFAKTADYFKLLLVSVKDFVVMIFKVIVVLIFWSLEKVWNLFTAIFRPIRNAFSYVVFGKRNTGGYDLRSRYVPTHVGDEDEASANFLKATEARALRAYRSTTNTICRGTSSVFGGFFNGKQAGKKICDNWWLLPLLLLLLLLIFSAGNPQVQEKMQNFRSSMPETFQKAYDKTGSFFGSIWGFFANSGNKVADAFKSVLGTGNAFFYNLVTGFTRIVVDSTTWLADKVGGSFGWVKTASTSLFSDAFRFLANCFRAAFDSFQTGLSTLWRWLFSFWATYGPSGAVGHVFHNVFEILKTGVFMIRDSAYYIVTFASSTFLAFVNGIKAGWEESKSHVPPPPPVPQEPVLPYTEDLKKQPLVINQSHERQISEADVDAKIQRTVASILENQVSNLIEKKIGLLLADIRHDYMSASKSQASQNQAELDSIKAQLKALQDIKVSILNLQKTEGSSLDMSALEGKINAAILKYNSDRTGIPDYALESAGGSVVSTRCSETYPQASRLEKLFNIPLWYSNYGPRTVIQRSSPALVPGECWAFTGGVGFLTIKLARSLRVTSISYEHVAKELTPDGQIQSAPKEMTFFAYKDVMDIQTRVKLGDFLYKDTGDSLQFFDITVDPGFPVEYVELQVDSNYGAAFTCLYRLRIHGKTMGPPVEDELIHDEL